MATTATYSGALSLGVTVTAALGGDRSGTSVDTAGLSAALAPTGGTAPTISGSFKGTATCAAGDWLLAHASDPLGTMGDATYSTGFTVASSKLKVLMVVNLDSTNSITIARGTTNGLPIFNAADDAITLAPGDCFFYYKQAGTAALTTGSNDKLTISVSGGSPTATVMAVYGP
jgi:hypothetical protein